MAASTTLAINAEVADKKLETTNTTTELSTITLSSSSSPAPSSSECKTVFKILSNIKNTEISSDPNNIQYLNDARILSLENDEDILLLKRDPTTNESSINKSAYFKLHKSSCPGKSNTLDKIKEKYENKSDSENIEPIIIGFNKTLAEDHQHFSGTLLSELGCNNKPPIAPKPRNSKLSKSQIITPTKKELINARRSLNIEKNKSKDVNSNELYEEDSISDEEADQYITVVRRSTSSEESVTKFDKELSAFVMDNTKKKSGLKKFFSVFSSSKDKKKKQEKFKQQNGGDSVKNDANNFNRQSSYRHTTGPETCINPVNLSAFNKIQRSDSSVVNKVPNKYSSENCAQMHNINQYNHQQKQNFDNSFNNGYTPMNKPFPSSLNNPYMNIPNVRKFIDTSSSASTLDHESERFNFNQTEISGKSSLNDEEETEIRNYPLNSFRANRISDDRRDTPPRLIETQQDVRLVNPKASIPINSERALPNPYHQNNNGNRESPKINTIPRKIISPITPPISPRKTYLNDTYGTVFDNVVLDISKEVIPKGPAKPPRLPSVIVESSKLRLPLNREIIPLSPRMKSPIPPENISTDKIIATELLKPKNKPSAIETRNQEPSHQNLEIDIDYPEDLNYASKDSLLGNLDRSSLKPPLPSPRNITENLSRASRSSNESVILRNKAQPIENNRITTDVQVHASSPLNRTPTPINNYASSNQNLSLSPRKPTNLSIRSATPPGSRISESPKTTPQKEDMRKSVEAYYWKEIKKLKDQENYELYMMQMQYGQIPYGGENINVRRSRSMSPLASRNGQRSLSLPRETRPPHQQLIIPERIYPNVIPENQPMVQLHQPRSMQQLQFQQQQYFLRSTPERSTINGSPSSSSRNTNSLYRPIFKRGSLNSPPQKVAQIGCDDTLKRKVSFSGAQAPTQVWPTKNGFTQSPPQRRMDKLQSLGENDDDDVFYDTTNQLRNDLPNDEEIYYNSIRHQGPPLMLRASQNSLYLSQINRRPPSQHHQEETLYGQPMDTLLRVPPPSRMPRYGSIQIQEELYGQGPSRRMSYQNVQQRPTPSIQSGQLESPYGPLPQRSNNNQMLHQVPRREVIVNDEIFGQFGGYTNSNNVRVIHHHHHQSPQTIYNSSRQSISIADHNSRVRDELYQRQPIIHQQNKQQISVSNKVCDIYGKIHDIVDPNNKQVQQSGVLMGQLQPGSPVMVRQMDNHQQQSSGQNYFVRNNRLTASANDMQIRRVGPSQQTLYGRLESNNNYNNNAPPSRPLPPVPQKKGLIRGNIISDTESGSDASEIQRIMNGGKSKNKKKGFFSSK